MISNFSSFSNFLSMGGYGAYVWSAYGIVGVVLLGQVVRVKRIANTLLKKFRSQSVKPSES